MSKHDRSLLEQAQELEAALSGRSIFEIQSAVPYIMALFKEMAVRIDELERQRLQHQAYIDEEIGF